MGKEYVLNYLEKPFFYNTYMLELKCDSIRFSNSKTQSNLKYIIGAMLYFEILMNENQGISGDLNLSNLEKFAYSYVNDFIEDADE